MFGYIFIFFERNIRADLDECSSVCKLFFFKLINAFRALIHSTSDPPRNVVVMPLSYTDIFSFVYINFLEYKDQHGNV